MFHIQLSIDVFQSSNVVVQALKMDDQKLHVRSVGENDYGMVFWSAKTVLSIDYIQKVKQLTFNWDLLKKEFCGAPCISE